MTNEEIILMKDRLKSLEDWRTEIRIERAQEQERIKVIKFNIETVSEDIKNIKSGVTKIMYLVIASLIGAFITFVINGGLKIG